MKKIIFSLLIGFSVLNLSLVSTTAYSAELGSVIEVKEPGFFDPLIEIYNKIINLTKSVIEKNMKKVVKSANRLLATMAGGYIIIMGARSLLNGSPFLSETTQKMFLFLVIASLLNFKWFDFYILKNLENLFNNLPSLFSSGGGDAISNIVNQTSDLSSIMWTAYSSISWTSFIMTIGAIIGILALSLLTLIVLINVLILTVEFYVVLSLSSIWLLLFFFKFTRSLAMGAVQVVYCSIIKITLLSVFLSMFGGIIKEALVFNDENEFFASCMGVVVLSFVAIILLKIVNEIANRIAGGTSSLAGLKKK